MCTSFFRAVFERATRTPFGASRWTVAGKLRMSDAVSDWVFVALAVAVSAVNAAGGTTGWDRAFAIFAAATTTLVLLLVLVRAGILALAIMYITAALLARMPMRFSPDLLYAAGSWIALAVLLGLAVYGFRLATRAPSGRLVS